MSHSDILDDAAIEFVQQEDGRWRWIVRTAQASARLGLPVDTPSMLSFRNEFEASADVAVHADAPRDASGRQVMTRDYLRRMISAVARTCPACADVYFGGVYWHRRDASGANWGVDVANGEGDYAACLASMAAAREDLRRRYSIADEA